MNLLRWILLALSAPLGILKAPSVQRRYHKLKFYLLPSSPTSSWHQTQNTTGNALPELQAAFVDQLATGGSAEFFLKYVLNVVSSDIGLTPSKSAPDA